MKSCLVQEGKLSVYRIRYYGLQSSFTRFENVITVHVAKTLELAKNYAFDNYAEIAKRGITRGYTGIQIEKLQDKYPHQQVLICISLQALKRADEIAPKLESGTEIIEGRREPLALKHHEGYIP